MNNTNSIRHDAFDHMVFDDIYRQSKELQALTEQGERVVKTFASLGEDVFYSLYKTKPELIKQGSLPPEYILNYEQMAKLMESPSYFGLREYTQLDELGAGLGSKALLQSLLRQFQEDSKLKEATEKINEAMNTQSKVDKMDKYTIEFEQTMAETNAATDNARQIIRKMQSKLRQAAEKAAVKATAEVEAAESIIISWGLNKGEFARLPYAKKLEILKVLRSQQKFRDMTKLVGRMRSLAIGSRQTKLEHRMELHSITQGDDINHVLPQELLSLKRPLLKLDFYRRLMEKQLLQYDLTNKDPVGQGPIITLIDTSSSMRNGGKEVWSKAAALGLAEIADKEKRAFAYALFASKDSKLITDEFQAGKRSPDKLLRLASEFIGGGTDFQQPLTWAMGKLKESRFNKADVVVITDGECAVSDEFHAELLKVKAEKQFRMYSILIGGNLSELNRWSDDVWSITDLLDENTIKELFNKI